MTVKIMCDSCDGAGGWGCGEDADQCFKCGGSGEVPIADLPNRTAPVNGKPDALHTDYMTLAPVRSIFDKATAETRANAERGEFLANQQVQQAYNHRYARQIAQGLGFTCVTDALAKLAAMLAAEPVACVYADALEAIKDESPRAEIERAGKGGVAA
jgi:hypothetical protein